MRSMPTPMTDADELDTSHEPAWLHEVDRVCSALEGAPENLFDEDKCQVVYEGASKAAQEFFALLAKSEEVDGLLGALQNLVVEGLDLDQIWQEIESQQKPLEKILKKKMKFLEKLAATDGIQLLSDVGVGATEVSDASTASEGEDEDADMVSEASSTLGSDQEEEEDGEEEGEEVDKKGPKRSAVDEGLFKLADMNDFLESEDKKDAEIAARNKAKGQAGEDEEEDDDDDEENEWGDDDEFMDLEKPLEDDGRPPYVPYSLEDRATLDSEEVGVDKLMYSDFFDAPEEGDEVAVAATAPLKSTDDEDEEEEGLGGLPEGENLDDEEEAALEEQLKEMQGELTEGEEEEEEEDESVVAADDEEEKASPVVAAAAPVVESRRSETSALKKRIEEMENEIEEMEREQLDEKHWTMTGEATGSSRPLNSLLEQHIDLPFSKLAARRAEKQWEDGEEEEDELTQGTAGAFKLDVDAIIKQRVADELYDDVIKRSEEEVLRLKGSQEGDDSVETLNFQKSRLGLADVYAKQYEAEMLGQQTDAELQQDADRVELRRLFAKLMHKLDTLTNQNFTPRPVLDSTLSKAAKDGDAPAIRMEEAVPITVAAGGTEGNEVTKGPEKQKVREEMSTEEKAAVRGNKKAKRRQKAKESIEKGNVTVGDRRAREAKLIEKNKKEKAERKARKEGPGNDKSNRKIRTTALMAAAADSAGRDVRRSEAKRKEGRSDATAGGSKRVKL
ncbi:U3 small nucleolar ribonucleoprotein mpp10, putative [Perkinsus marinus ATCC 50983]|uniref:U3 small nucleolar ribonucleoprotein mpp10, putative n=1 Tax=Perkinsus marinus (strain ATCC 50983 / TXsc) TaxID=423536 RepID=C5KT79_PERM5|nr:U3 small nucleolar ribonucleoprotein mpp10, putative [Perkinsus marinus ATCC 50983]EER12429.1 U3 small nucleolar ribonucleoprotein mpp10, putative [Perkinsus marinus ATCC 50983]|eukprot:XP_002780634.1 U3 small nucleolar ribonucleoprotein mpp10, putative [Perkinsus marinus ATCC 50983]